MKVLLQGTGVNHGAWCSIGTNPVHHREHPGIWMRFSGADANTAVLCDAS